LEKILSTSEVGPILALIALSPQIQVMKSSERHFFTACLEYFIFFSIDSSEARKQYDEYCLSIMQTVHWMEFVSHVKFRQLQTQRLAYQNNTFSFATRLGWLAT
jgi:hypothetical protein